MQQSLIQEKTDNKTIGRVLAIRDISISVIYIVSLIIGGILGEFFGIRLVYFMASLIYIIVSIIISFYFQLLPLIYYTTIYDFIKYSFCATK